MISTILRFVAVLLLATSMAGQGAPLPELAQLKLAAEEGDRVAQFDYGRRIAGMNYQEQFVWYMRSAEQGYAPAQDAIGTHIASQAPYDQKKRAIAEREALRWMSRAAFQGLPAAQLHLFEYYERGVGVAKDPIVAYMWAQIALNNPNSGMMDRTLASLYRDRIIANTSSDNVSEGQRRAAQFTYPNSSGLNPIEAELLFSQLRLVGIFHLNGRDSAAVNNVRFYPGETKDVKVDDHVAKLTCTEVESNFARFKMAGMPSEFALTLKR